MSLKDLSKEKQQYAVLGAIVLAGVLVLIGFGIKVSLSSISNAKQDLFELSSKIESAGRTVEQSRRQHVEFLSSIRQLKKNLDTIPPERNYYSWATEVIYKEARLVNIEIDAIDEVIIAATEDETGDRTAVEMETYSLRITAHGDYESVKRLLRQLSDNHSLVRVTGIELSAGTVPDIHDVQLFIEWPFNMAYIADAWKGAGSEALDPGVDNEAIVESEDPGSTNTPHPPPPRSGEEDPAASVGADEARASVPANGKRQAVCLTDPATGELT